MQVAAAATLHKHALIPPSAFLVFDSHQALVRRDMLVPAAIAADSIGTVPTIVIVTHVLPIAETDPIRGKVTSKDA